jgi:uncharacterized protein (TIGR02145 family)
VQGSLETVINPLATPEFTISGASTGTVTVAETVSGTEIGITQVNWGDGVTNNQITHSYNASNSYNITVYYTNGCSKKEEAVEVTVPGGGGQETPTINRKLSCVLAGTDNHITTNHPSINTDKYSNNKDIEKGRDLGNGIVVLDSVSDFEGYWYKVVQIGTQCWLKENMRATKYSDGSTLVHRTSDPQSSETNRCYYYAGLHADSAKKYGYVYNWAAAVNCSNSNYINNGNSNSNFEQRQGICPTGWHIPTNEEWKTMETFINEGEELSYPSINTYYGTIAGKLAYGNWSKSNVTQNTTDGYPGNYEYQYRNSSGFSALPAEVSKSFIGTRTRFWTSTNFNTTNNNKNKISRWLHKSNSGIRYAAEGAYNALSVRCVRNQ